MGARFEFDFNSFIELKGRIESVGGNLETEINKVLKDEGKKTVEPSITNLIPVSKKKKGSHAKNSKWSTQKLGNLELTIKAKGGAANKPNSFGYLVFPNDGIGSRNHRAQEFMEKGRDAGLPKLVAVTQQKLIEKIEEVL